MSISEFSVRNPVLVNLLTVIIIVVGIFTYLTIVRELFPNIPHDQVQITAFYPNTSPDEIEETITRPIEDAVIDLKGIESMSSISIEGLSAITLEVKPDEDAGELARKVEAEINKLEDYPEDAEEPDIEELEFNFPVIQVSLRADVPEKDLRKTAENLRDRLREIDGVSNALLAGVREREIWVEVDRKRLNAYGLSLADVIQAIARRNQDIPAGTIKAERQEFLVRTKEDFESLEEIEMVIVRSRSPGQVVQVRDLATVSDTFEESKTQTRLFGEPAAMVLLLKGRAGNMLEIKREVDRIAGETRQKLLPPYRLDIVMDFSLWIRERIATMEWSGLMGLSLVIVLLCLFLDWRMALMVSLGIPFAFMAAMIVMKSWGVSLNMISMFGMIMVLGMLVDDAIVVGENIYRHIESGMPRREAAIRGSKEVTLPVLSAVSTTIAAFLPLLLMEGLIGKFLSEVPLVVSFSLAASLFEAFIVLPAHMAEWSFSPGQLRDRLLNKQGLLTFGVRPANRTLSPIAHMAKARPAGDPPPARPNSRWYNRLIRLYIKLLFSFLRFRYVSVAVLLALGVIAVYVAVYRIPFVLMQVRDVSYFKVDLEMPIGTKMEHTGDVLAKIEDAANRFSGDEVKSVVGYVGFYVDDWGVPHLGSHFATAWIDLTPFRQRRRYGDEIMHEMRRMLGPMPEARSVKFVKEAHSPPVGKAVAIRIRGERFEILQELAQDVQEYLKTLPGTVEVSSNFQPGKGEMRVQLDDDRLRALGLDSAAVAQAIRFAIEGGEAGKFHDADDELDIIVKYRESDRDEVEDLSHIHFAHPQGKLVPFDNVARINPAQGYAQIYRYENQRCIIVYADVQSDVTTSREVNQKALARFGTVSAKYPSYTFEYGGENEDTEESIRSFIRAFSVALLIIYFIMASLFRSYIQPLIILASVPFSFLGVLVGLLVSQEPIGIMVLIGIVALNGIVVNDAIIMVNFINRGRARGLSRWHAVVRAGRHRMRPVLLTSITTIGGLCPLIFWAEGTSQFLTPMATTVCWGLGFATILTLLVVPCVYSIVDDVKQALGIPLSGMSGPE